MRIPTYSFRNTESGLEVYGPGSNGNIFPNLVFIRGKDYRILSLSEDSVIEIYHDLVFYCSHNLRYVTLVCGYKIH